MNMKLLVAAAVLGLAMPAGANPGVTVNIVGIKVQQGAVRVALFDEAHWTGAPIAVTRTVVTGATATATLAAPGPGRYGVKLYHDVNGDGHMATNAFGAPAEPYGFSNNAVPRFAPPPFAAAAFTVGPDGAVQTIALR